MWAVIRVAANEYKVSFWSDEHVLKLHYGDGCATLYPKLWNYTLLMDEFHGR